MLVGIQECSSGLLSFVCKQGGKFSVSFVSHRKYTFHYIFWPLSGKADFSVFLFKACWYFLFIFS